MIANGKTSRINLTSGQLYDAACPQRQESNAAWANAPEKSDDVHPTIQCDEVEVEAHADRVDAGAGDKPHACPGRECAASEESDDSRAEAIGKYELCADRLAERGLRHAEGLR